MQIAEIEVDVLIVPLSRTFAGGTYQVEVRKTLVCRVRLSDGTQTECFSGNGHEDPHAVAQLVHELSTSVVGTSVHHVERNWERLLARAAAIFSPVRQRLLMHAIGTIDTALWHTRGVVEGKPVWRLLGGDPDPLPVMITAGYYESGDDRADVERTVEDLHDAGVRALKLKVGASTVDADLRKLSSVRELVGDGFGIVCDANRAWDRRSAERFAHGCRDLDVEWLEEPITWLHEDVELPRLRRAVSVPLAAGQSEISPQGAVALIERGAVDVINFDATWGGGITGWRKVAGYAQLRDVRVGHHSECHLSVHLLTTVPDPGFVEIYQPDRDPVWYGLVEPLPIRDGCMQAPSAPGLGLELDPNFVRRFRVT